MRRGHPNNTSISGWRNEISRNFRPRGGGTSHFRPPRPYPLHGFPRFPRTGPRPPRGPGGYSRAPLHEHMRLDHHNRNTYRPLNNHQHQLRSQVHDVRYHYVSPQLSKNNSMPYSNTSVFRNVNDSEQCHINIMGDIDERHPVNPSQLPYNGNQKNFWDDLDENIKSKVDDMNSHKTQWKQVSNNEINKFPTLEYTGHRPPSSDYYGVNTAAANDNSKTFSRSVDDTVDIVRKRLLNRNESQQQHEDLTSQENHDENIMNIENNSINYSGMNPEPQIKKRIQRQRQNVKSNCDKIKNKIVHQLFKMDKDKIHKLMDNPSSSSKFEYAISSLITESQNSLNRHLRSVAEKSLCSSATEVIQNDNNTIYEDTFMKQMQCILDPQDTVLLEDIKPMVMAELNKVLQLDEYDQRFEIPGDKAENKLNETHLNEVYYNISSNCDELCYPESGQYDQNTVIEDLENLQTRIENNSNDFNLNIEETKPLFERRPLKKAIDFTMDESFESINIQNKIAVNTISQNKTTNNDSNMLLFDVNVEKNSDDEDPFAELDQQYHVEVDPNFIDADDPTTSQITENNNKYNKNEVKQESIVVKSFETPVQNDDQKQSNPIDNRNCDDSLSPVSAIKIDRVFSCIMADELDDESKNINNSMPNEVDEKSEQSNSTSKSSIVSKLHKRSVNRRPLHRKEKRKKSESLQSDSSKQILNKNIIINVNDCAAQSAEISAKSIFNLFFSKTENTKSSLNDTEKNNTLEKEYSDKYVKRKEISKPVKQNTVATEKRKSSTSSSHSIVSPKESDNADLVKQTCTKIDSKTKLKTIDMFTEQPKKSSIHQAHRNTATISNLPAKVEELNHFKQFGRVKLLKRHVATQVMKKTHSKETQTKPSCTSRFSQTIVKKFVTKAIQTDPIILDKLNYKSDDTLERMKEIDLEIQLLIQEKFKLYNSLETKDSCPGSAPTLGMTVLSVTKANEPIEDGLSEDAIVEDFTNIPVEELEQIAFESVQSEQIPSPKLSKKTQHKQIPQLEKTDFISPAKRSTNRSTKKKVKSPNISLIEQIITDDRPLEDIISLDEFETPPKKLKKKCQKPKKKNVKAKNIKVMVNKMKYDFKIKQCSVSLIREDISKYLKVKARESTPPMPHDLITEQDLQIIEQSIDSDIHFDMLDVSEDIVIGESCEVKLIEDKDIINDELIVPLNEEIILDNSQSSSDDILLPDTSQNDNQCKMYDYSSDENLRRDSITVTGNADAVLALECIDSSFIAACLDGNVYHFNNDGILITTLRGSNLAVTCLTIVKEKYGTTVYTGSLDSRIRYFDLETGLEKGPECNVLSPIQTMDRAWDTIFVGTRTGFVLQFECKNNMLIPVSTVKFSEQSILALRAMKEGARKVLLVAARSENVTIRDAQTGLLLRTLVGPKMTVYTLLFEDGKVYCGTSSHQIYVFDYTSGSHVGSHSGGKGAVCLRASGGLLFAGCYDGCVYVYREGEGRPFAQLRGPSMMLLSLAIVGSKIIAGYKDRSLYIWKIPLSILQEMVL